MNLYTEVKEGMQEDEKKLMKEDPSKASHLTNAVRIIRKTIKISVKT